MQAEIKGDKLVITIAAVTENPPLSKRGKSYLIACSGGFTKMALQVDGKNVMLNVVAYIPR